MPGLDRLVKKIKQYEQFKKKTINPLEKRGNYLLAISKLLEYMMPKVIEALTASEESMLVAKESLEVAKEARDNSINQFNELRAHIMDIKEFIKDMEAEIMMIPFSRTLSAGEGVRLTEYMPFNGRVVEVEIHWPSGCNALVDVMVGHNNTQFCPREGFLALDNATPKYTFNEDVAEHEELWVQMENADALKPHTISANVFVRRAH